MFIEISPHEGVLFEPVYKEELKPLAESYRLNLNFVRKVFFGKEDAYEKGNGSISFEPRTNIDRVRDEWLSEDYEEEERERINREALQKFKKITLNQITFEVTSFEVIYHQEQSQYFSPDKLFLGEEITLYFTKEGEGEYQRIKRIIDEKTLR